MEGNPVTQDFINLRNLAASYKAKGDTSSELKYYGKMINNNPEVVEGYLLRSLDPGNPKPSGFRKNPTEARAKICSAT